MKNRIQKEEYLLLVYRNLKGELSPDEFAMLNAETARNSNFAALRFETEEIWDLDASEETLVSNQETQNLLKHIKKGKTKVFNLKRFISSVAAVLVVVFGALWLMNDRQKEYLEAGQYVLADNSTITLRENSTLKVQEFTATNRRVELTGEAYFEVAEDKNRPFSVSSKNVKISVLGTTFLVKESGENTFINLVEGKISTLDTRSLSIQILTAGMNAHHNPNGEIVLSEKSNLAGWKEGIFEYKNATLSEVTKELELIYNTKITITNQELHNCKFNGILSENSLENILNRIAGKFKIEIRQEESNWILTGGVCE